MKQNRNSSLFSALLVGLFLCTTGCASTTGAPEQTEESSVAALPPLVTTTETEEISLAETTVSTMETEPSEPRYSGMLAEWKLPEEMDSLQTVRFRNHEIYILGLEQDEMQQTYGVLFWASPEQDLEFRALFPSAESTSFSGLMDFDVLSDGTICGLLCEGTGTISFNDPNFDPNTFDWEAYYENYITQYQLVWYDSTGIIVQKLGLSTLLDLDENAKQTMTFTGVRCDASDQIYLTATIDDQECLMALDAQGNLCPVQGHSSYMLSLNTPFQWIRNGTDGMLLLEEDAEDGYTLSHVIVTDGALWKTQYSMPEGIAVDENTLFAEQPFGKTQYGVWNEVGLYHISDENSEAELLYSWDALHLNTEEIADVLLISESNALITTYTPYGNKQLQLLVPEEMISETEPVSEETQSSSQTDTHSETPMATPISTTES